MPFDAEDLARTALVRLIPRGRYRIAAPGDARFAGFSGSCARVAFRQQGARPSFLLFVGPDQDPRAAAQAAADWAAANWRPNAVQKRVSPGVVAIQVGPAAQLAPAGPVTGAAVPAVVWTVDAGSGRATTSGSAPGAPPGGEIRRAAQALSRGLPPPPLGQLDYAEREIMHARGAGMAPVLTGGLAIILVLFAVRFGFSALLQVLVFAGLLAGGVNPLVAMAGLALNLLLVAGIVLGVALLLNLGGLALRAPGFASVRPGRRTASWVAFGAAMAVLAVGTNYVIPRTLQPRPGQAQTTHVSATALDDGSTVEVALGGSLRVDLRGWPSSEWDGVHFATSNPSVLGEVSTPGASDPPVATFTALGGGTARVDATSRDGRYSFELRVSVITG